ncbi:hypothetical protein BG004_000891 [Podila humilis]|nr:hypothetical protein BG004_000891 [Podila humilis]
MSSFLDAAGAGSKAEAADRSHQRGHNIPNVDLAPTVFPPPLPTTKSTCLCHAQSSMDLDHIATTPSTVVHLTAVSASNYSASTDGHNTTATTQTSAKAKDAAVPTPLPAGETKVNSKSILANTRTTSRVSRASIATLLSVTMTMILLSLLQGKRRYARRQRRSLMRNISRHHSRHHSQSSQPELNNPLPNASPKALHCQHQHQQQQQHGQQSCLACHKHDRSTTFTQSPQNEEVARHVHHEPSTLNSQSTFHQCRLSQRTPPLPNVTSSTYIQQSQIHSQSPYGRAGSVAWSLSDGHLPSNKSKQAFVDAWLHEQRHADGVESVQEHASEPKVDIKLKTMLMPCSRNCSEECLSPMPMEQEEQQHRPPYPGHRSISPDQHNWQQHSCHSRHLRDNNRSNAHQLDPRYEHSSHLNNCNSSNNSESDIDQSSRPPPQHHPHPHPHPHFHNHNYNQRHSPPIAPRRPSFVPSQLNQRSFQHQYPHQQHLNFPNSPQQSLFRAQNIPESHTQPGYYYPQQQQAQFHRHQLQQSQGIPPAYPITSAADHIQHGLRRSLSLTYADRSNYHQPVQYSPPQSPLPTEHLSPVEKARYEHQIRRERQQIQHLQHRQNQHDQLQHPRPFPGSGPGTRLLSPLQQNSSWHSVHPLDPHGPSEPLTYPPKHYSLRGRSANELAWERHSYYQYQQQREEMAAEQMRMDTMQPRHQLWQQQKAEQLQDHQERHPQEQDLVSRTSSLNRLTSHALSPRTAQELGLSRSKSVLGHGSGSEQKRGKFLQREKSVASSRPSLARTFVPADLRVTTTKSEPMSMSSCPPPRPSTPKESIKSMLADCPVFSVGMRLMRKSEPEAEQGQKKIKESNPETLQDVTTTSSTATTTTTTTTSTLSRRRTLKDLGPSLKSLARRCSTRLSRPNSFAGSNSDPLVQFPEGDNKSKTTKTHSLQTKTSHSSNHTPVRPLQIDTDGVVDLQQTHQPSVQYFPPSPTERTPIHRRVTLFRPEITTPSVACTNSGMTTHDNNSEPHSTDEATTPKTPTPGPSMAKRDSLTLRFANGRGLDLTMFDPTSKTVTTGTQNTTVSSIQRSATALEGALPALAPIVTTIGLQPTPSVSTPNTAVGQAAEAAKTTTTTTTTTTSSSSSSPSLCSPMDEQEWTRRQVIAILAMGRKERISAKTGQQIVSNQTMVPSTYNNNISKTLLSPLALEAQDVPTTNQQAEGLEEADPCEKIAFMLVPKSRYEFQPLVGV